MHVRVLAEVSLNHYSAAQVVTGENVSLHQCSYAELDHVLDELNLEQVDRVLLDLGLSSDQLADPQRGFGFDTTGTLDMRFDTTTGRSVEELLRSGSVDELSQIFSEYGEERAWRTCARAICIRRKDLPFVTTQDLVSCLIKVIPRRAKRHPCTQIFQALRIAVNKELDALQEE